METLVNRFAAMLEKYVMPVAAFTAKQRHLCALRDGFIATVPISMVGSIVVMLKEVVFLEWSIVGEKLNTIPYYHESIQPILDKTIIAVLNQIWWGTLALGIIFSVFSISYCLARINEVEAVSAGLISTVAYLILTPQSYGDAGFGTMSWTYFNSEALFTGMIVAFTATELYTYAVRKGWTIKMPEQVPPAVSKAFSAIIPAALVFTVFGIISAIFLMGVGYSVKDFINMMLQKPLTNLGQSVFTLLFLLLVHQVLWFFGLHGSLIVGPAYDMVWGAALKANSEAVLIHGTEPTHLITRNMIDVYAMHGGSGATFGLLIAIFIFSKREEHKELAKLAIAPSTFQINEPVIYGLPIVLNPIMCIPFIFVPVILVGIGWFFTYIGFAGYIYIAPPWVMPPVFSAFLATGGDLGATAVAAGTLVLSVLMYAPFVIIANREAEKENY